MISGWVRGLSYASVNGYRELPPLAAALERATAEVAAQRLGRLPVR